MDNNRQLQYLKRMGITVWVPRDSTVSPSALAEQDQLPEEIGSASVPETCLQFLVYGEFGVCCALSGDTDTRQFIDDVAFAMVRQKIKPEIDEMRSIQDSGSMGQTSDSERQLQQFVNRNIRKLHGTVIVFGKLLQDALDDGKAELLEAGLGKRFQLGECLILVVEEEIGSYMGNPDRKRALWRAINATFVP